MSTATTPMRTYSPSLAMTCPMRNVPPIAEAWDATFTLVDGVPLAADLDRLAGQVPYQEGGRVGAGELLGAGHESARLWRQVVDAWPPAGNLDLASRRRSVT